MIKNYLILIFLVFITNYTNAQTTDRDKLLEDAELAHTEKNYTLAIEKYEALLATNQYSDELYANLGLSYLLIGEVSKSILNLEKALLINPGNYWAKTNLKLAQEGIEDRVSFIPDFVLIEWWRGLVKSLSSSTWIVFHAIMLLMGLIFLAFYWLRLDLSFSGRIRSWKGTVPVIIGSVLLSALFLLMASQRNEQLHDIDYGVLMDHASLLQGSDERSTVITNASAGSRVKVLDDINDWYKVQLDDKDEGWVLKTQLELIRI